MAPLAFTMAQLRKEAIVVGAQVVSMEPTGAVGNWYLVTPKLAVPAPSGETGLLETGWNGGAAARLPSWT